MWSRRKIAFSLFDKFLFWPRTASLSRCVITKSRIRAWRETIIDSKQLQITTEYNHGRKHNSTFNFCGRGFYLVMAYLVKSSLSEGRWLPKSRFAGNPRPYACLVWRLSFAPQRNFIIMREITRYRILTPTIGRYALN